MIFRRVCFSMSVFGSLPGHKQTSQAKNDVRSFAQQQTVVKAAVTSASLIGRLGSSTFRLSAITVSMSLAGSCFSSESAPRPFHHGIRRRGGTIFGAALRLTDDRSKRTYELTSSSSREGHRSTAWWNSSFLLSHWLIASHDLATSRVHRNSVPSIQMRCMITANRRASATIAFFIPRCLAIFIAQALSQDHFAKRTSMI
jgi:hypothetical protein